MARPAPDESDGPRARQRDLDTPPELHRNGPFEAECGDAAAHSRLPRGAAPRAQRAAARGRLCARLSGKAARQPRNGRDDGGRRDWAEGALARSPAGGPAPPEQLPTRYTRAAST